MSVDKTTSIAEYAALCKKRVRDYRRGLPLRRRVSEYLLDWKQAGWCLLGRELKDPSIRLRQISSDPAMALIRLSCKWRWRS